MKHRGFKMMCVIYKWILSFYITEERQLPGYIRRHIKKCRTCRDYYNSSIRLTESLRTQAAAGLHAIAVSEVAENSKPRKSFSLPGWLRTAAFIAIAAGALIAFSHNRAYKQKQLECFDVAADMLFDTSSLRYTILTDSDQSRQIAAQYHGLPEIFREATNLFFGNLSTGIEEKPNDRF